MIGNDVFTEHSDYKWFRLEHFLNSRNSLCSPATEAAITALTDSGIDVVEATMK